MTFEEARQLVSSYLETLGVKSPGLNSSGMGGAVVGDLEVYFEYAPKKASSSWIGLQATKGGHDVRSTLGAHARIYTFMRAAKPAVLDELRKASEDPDVPNGGGQVTYMSENKGLFLSRSYDEVPTGEDFSQQIDELMTASRHWLDHVISDCLERARSKK